MGATRWTYVFYRGEDVDFVGDEDESMQHYGITKDHLRWLAYPIAKRRAEADPESRRLYAVRVDPDQVEEEEEWESQIQAANHTGS